MIPRSDYRTAEVVQLLTKLIQLLYPFFTDTACRRQMREAIDNLHKIDDTSQTESLHRLFLAALHFAPDAATDRALKQLDHAMPNPWDWDKMLEAFCATIKFLLALFRPHSHNSPDPTILDLQALTTEFARKTVTPEFFDQNAPEIADALDNFCTHGEETRPPNPDTVRAQALDLILDTAGEHRQAWVDFTAALNAALDDEKHHGRLNTFTQTFQSIHAIARGLRDLLPKRTNPLHAPPLPEPPAAGT